MPEIKISSVQKKKLKTLVKMMDKQNERMTPATQPLLEALNIVLSSDELNYLLKKGTELHTYEQSSSFCDLPEEKFNSILESLKTKGFIKTKYSDNGDEKYILNPIVVGWLEGQVPYLIGKPEETKFARKFQDEYIGLNSFSD